MKFRTTVEVSKSDHKIRHDGIVVMLGSCFTTNIGQKLIENKFNVWLNPFGTLYNPVSIKQNLELLIEKRVLGESDIFYDKGLYNSCYFHGSFASANKEDYLEKINKSIIKASEKLCEAKTLLITFGTSYVYEDKATERVVANCHKLPASSFSRYRLEVNDVVEDWKELIPRLEKINPELKIIFTISPIRHLRDGAHDNQLSKSTLLLAIEKLIELFPAASYFPSYEIVLDDLRDYRFYEPDMCHPNAVATEYIWEKFDEMYFDDETRRLIEEWNKIKRDIDHKPFNPDGEEYMQFLNQSLLKLKSFQKEYPFICVFSEVKSIEEKINR